MSEHRYRVVYDAEAKLFRVEPARFHESGMTWEEARKSVATSCLHHERYWGRQVDQWIKMSEDEYFAQESQ